MRRKVETDWSPNDIVVSKHYISSQSKKDWLFLCQKINKNIKIKQKI